MPDAKVTIKRAEYERLKRDSERLKKLLDKPMDPKQHIEKRVREEAREVDADGDEDEE